MLYDVIKEDRIYNKTKLELIAEFDSVLSLDLLKEEVVNIDSALKEKIERLINERNQAKEIKNYSKADEIRDYLLTLGVTIKDSKEGTTYEIKEEK